MPAKKPSRYPKVSIAPDAIDPAVASLVPENFLRRHMMVPLKVSDGVLTMAMADPSDVLAADDVRTITGMKVEIVIADEQEIAEAIIRVRHLDSVIELDETEDESDDIVTSAEFEDAPIVRLVNDIITRAVAQRASDVHIEPGEHDVRVRYRIDGVLHEVRRTPSQHHRAVISRLKVMADLDIAERRIPQDGRISMTVETKSIDLRVATLPSAHGEKVVLRILDRSNFLLDLKALGFSPIALKLFEESYRRPWGTILVTGPTGSGKSTTLYGTLNILRDPSRNIITVEDPIEYRMEGITQVQVHRRAGLTFASALRSILRADPDIMMIGEIRDAETAEIAIESALTGHLVLSTLHTNDAPSAPARLVEMGVEPYLVASALDCVLAQRLARRLCDKCKVGYEPKKADLKVLGDSEPEGQLFKAVGCSFCSGTGYRGRLALAEVMPVNDEITSLIAERRGAMEVREAARAAGLVDLRAAGMEKAAEGTTSIEEILRVVI